MLCFVFLMMSVIFSWLSSTTCKCRLTNRFRIRHSSLFRLMSSFQSGVKTVRWRAMHLSSKDAINQLTGKAVVGKLAASHNMVIFLTQLCPLCGRYLDRGAHTEQWDAARKIHYIVLYSLKSIFLIKYDANVAQSKTFLTILLFSPLNIQRKDRKITS